MKETETFQAMVANQDDCCGFSNLEFDHAYPEEVIRAIQRLKSLAPRVVLVHLPENPRFERSPQAKARMMEMTEKIRREAQVELVEIGSKSKFEATDFIDPIHFNQSGVQKFSQELAQFLSSKLKIEK
jgi:lysophospholipase L1-like esterase